MDFEDNQEEITTVGTPVRQIAVLAGFPDPASFSRAYRRRYGLPPSKARRADSGAIPAL